MYGINKIFLDITRNDYSEHLSKESFVVDCSLGENPIGLDKDFKLNFDPISQISSYPHSEKIVYKAIKDMYSNIIDLKDENITLTCGSIGGLIGLNRMLLKENKDIIGISPQFTAIIDDFNLYKANYHPVYLKLENNLKFSLEDFLCEVNKYEESYIYIDNPNNPTGQVIDIKNIKNILDFAKKKNSFVCIDEAYGDYMDIENSAIKFINDYPNLAVVRTLSKGLGGAGIRSGYLISNEQNSSIFKKANIPFSTSSFSNLVSAQLIKNSCSNHAIEFSIEKNNIIKKVLKNIKIAHTSDAVSISTLYVSDKEIDLEKEFIKGGIRVISCSGYDGLGKNFIRINLNKDFDKMLTLLKKIDTKIGK